MIARSSALAIAAAFSAASLRRRPGVRPQITLRMECKECKYKIQLPLKRMKHFEIGANKLGAKKK